MGKKEQDYAIARLRLCCSECGNQLKKIISTCPSCGKKLLWPMIKEEEDYNQISHGRNVV